ncbi:MAG: DUF4349 domain-containing protein [Bacillota bacterium]
MPDGNGKPRGSGLVYMLAGIMVVGCLVIWTGAFLGGCGMRSSVVTTRSEPAMEKMEVGGAPAGYGSADTAKSPEADADRLVIRRKTLRLEVKDVGAAVAALENLADRNKGLVVSSAIVSSGTPGIGSEEIGNGPDSATVVVKVPEDRFAAVVKEMRKLGRLESEEQSSEEVTEQHIDLTARLKNMKRQEEQYLEILKSATKVEEMLKVEEQLTRIRGDIESLQAKVDYLERSASMATITVELFKPGSVAAPLVRWGIKDSFITALQGFVSVVNFFIIAVGTALPLLIIGFIAWLFLRARQKRRDTNERTMDGS